MYKQKFSQNLCEVKDYQHQKQLTQVIRAAKDVRRFIWKPVIVLIGTYTDCFTTITII